MLNMSQTIGYNTVTRSIHFFFFDRATARKYERVIVPFRGAVYLVSNMHQPNTRSVWVRQLGRSGLRTATIHCGFIQYDPNHGCRSPDRIFWGTYRGKDQFGRHEFLHSLFSDFVCQKVTVHMAICSNFFQGICCIIWFGEMLN